MWVSKPTPLLRSMEIERFPDVIHTSIGLNCFSRNGCSHLTNQIGTSPLIKQHCRVCVKAVAAVPKAEVAPKPRSGTASLDLEDVGGKPVSVPLGEEKRWEFANVQEFRVTFLIAEMDSE